MQGDWLCKKRIGAHKYVIEQIKELQARPWVSYVLQLEHQRGERVEGPTHPHGIIVEDAETMVTPRSSSGSSSDSSSSSSPGRQGPIPAPTQGEMHAKDKN